MSTLPDRPDLEYYRDTSAEDYLAEPGIVGRICDYALTLEQDAAGLRERLRSLERTTDAGDDWEYCAVCRNWTDEQHPKAGHRDDCALVPILALLGTAP